MTDIRLRTSDGSIVWIEGATVGAEQEVVNRNGERRISEVIPAVTALCNDLAGLLAQVGPDKATVEFGMSFRVETTGLALLVAKAGADANFKVALEWEAGSTPRTSPPPVAPVADDA